jgi:hypothetical protein
MQLWGWGDVKEKQGWGIDRIFIIKDDIQIGGAQLLIRKESWPFRTSVYVQYGPIIIEGKDVVFQQISDYAQMQHHAVAVVIKTNDIESEQTGWHEINTEARPAQTIVIDLEKPEGILFANMSSALRETIREVPQDAFHIKKIGSSTDIDACFDILKSNHRPYKKDVLHAINDKMGEYSSLFGAYENDALTAFLWVVISEDRAVEILQSTKSATTGAEIALRWDVIRRLKQWGLPSYDIGGVYAENMDDSKRGLSPSTINQPGIFTKPLAGSYNLWRKFRPIVDNDL